MPDEDGKIPGSSLSVTGQPVIPGGYIIIARKLLDSDLMKQSPLVVKLWFWLLLKANFKDRQQLKRGQLVTTIAEMQESMSHYAGWRKIIPTKDEIRTAYESLIKATRITTQKTTRGMVITIMNYNAYQDISAYASHTVDLKETVTNPSVTPHDTEECLKKKNIKPPSPESLRLSGLLADLVLRNNPRHRKLSNGGRETTVKLWAIDIDKLLRVDGQTPADVERVIIWSQSDPFWRNNILSGSKLRDQWDQLMIKMQGNGKDHNTQPVMVSREEEIEGLRQKGFTI